MIERLGEVQLALRELGLDGWLLYDFRGQNPIALRALGLAGLTLTRRFFYLLPATDALPVLVAHETERERFPELPGDVERYASWSALRDVLGRVLPSSGKIAMEYSPMSGNPYLSRVDAGTVELVRSYGPTVVPSSELVQRFMARWDEEQLASHRRVAKELVLIRDRAFEHVARAHARGGRVHEREVEDLILDAIRGAGLVTEGRPIVASGAHTSDPQYSSRADAATEIREGDLLLVDLWAKEATERAPFAEICWMAYAGREVPAEHARVFAVVAEARDRAIELLRSRAASGKRTHGFEVDRCAREIVARAGFGDRFVHRTGHHLGHALASGDGCTLDDFEIHDTREVEPGLAWSVHPAVYLDSFGVRTSVCVHLSERGLESTTPVQTAIAPLFA